MLSQNTHSSYNTRKERLRNSLPFWRILREGREVLDEESVLQRILPVSGLLVNEDPRMRNERVDIEAIARRQHAVADCLALIIDPVEDDVVQGLVDELNEGSVHVVDRTKQWLLLLLLLMTLVHSSSTEPSTEKLRSTEYTTLFPASSPSPTLKLRWSCHHWKQKIKSRGAVIIEAGACRIILARRAVFQISSPFLFNHLNLNFYYLTLAWVWF